MAIGKKRIGLYVGKGIKSKAKGRRNKCRRKYGRK